MVLINVDPAYFAKPEQYLARAQKILKRRKLDWPNAIAPHGFNDTVHAFNLSGYGNVVVDATGIVQGVNLDGKELERLIEAIVEGKPVDTPER